MDVVLGQVDDLADNAREQFVIDRQKVFGLKVGLMRP